MKYSRFHFDTIVKKYYKNENKKYGIEVIKRETKNNQVYEEKKQINSVTADEKIANKILDIFKKLQVTPITMEYVIEEFLK